jgi:putative acetyltransferase
MLSDMSDPPASTSLVVAVDDPTREDVVRLLERHLAFANEHSPPEDVHALDVTGLLAPSITFYSARDEGRLLGVGALKELDPTHGELKSMHTAIEARGCGVGRAVLDHVMAEARGRGYRRLSLETGSMDAFVPARSLYRSVGFDECEPFADYPGSPYSTCMTMELT